MRDRIGALGQYIVKETGKPFNFKLIKTSTVYKGILFTVGTEDFLVTDDKRELLATTELIGMRTALDYPVKLAKRYTHAKFQHIDKKKEEIFIVNGKKYYIVRL
ncbi:MAG: hypothetical protein MJH09_03865 [Cetobacterium sp.]|uniref:Uncharacterized protein n=1 Tax=Cetobacterium ceti TaxID=180163 RepID=A0A1T4K6X1_9FUSO|nr:hypothetical protein [Cetobacterium ceti]MCJ8341977.1 hypothetical protein [Cetobacterium sp.]SJZ38161.1 hypothetical protein SAMN02745174_00353 [Cetobacterium ceti]